MIIPLTQGQVAIVDEVDFERVNAYRWWAYWQPRIGGFYAATGIRKTDGRPGALLMHRLVVEAEPGQQVDHANHDPLDNRRANLRPCTQSENQRNRRASRPDNTSGFLGVDYRMGRRTPWRAQAQIEGRKHHIGAFSTARDAAVARDQWLRDGPSPEFSVYNFPLPGERGIEANQ